MSNADVFIGDLASMKGKIENDFNKAKGEHSRADLLVTDLLHEIEFGNPDAVTMVRIHKDMKAALLKRREVKDEMTKLQSLFAMMGHFKTVQKATKSLDNRTYTPRVLKELDFTDSSTLLKSRKNLPA